MRAVGVDGFGKGPVTVEVIAAELHVTPRTIQDWRKLFGLPFKKIGGRLLFDRGEVREWFRNWRGNGTPVK